VLDDEPDDGLALRRGLAGRILPVVPDHALVGLELPQLLVQRGNRGGATVEVERAGGEDRDPATTRLARAEFSAKMQP